MAAIRRTPAWAPRGAPRSPPGPRRRRWGGEARGPAAPRAGDGLPGTVDTRLSPEVTELLRTSKHPLLEEIDAVRRILLDASPEIREGIKWNAPSFRTTEWFATLNNPNNPRARNRVMLVLHTGAKAKGATARGRVADPSGLLEWLAEDRCIVTFKDEKDVEAKRAALEAIVRAWILIL